MRWGRAWADLPTGYTQGHELSAVSGDGLPDTITLVITCAPVILSEVVNTAIEPIVDRIGPERDPLSGQAKDPGSAAVFVALCLFLVAWIPSLWQYSRGP